MELLFIALGLVLVIEGIPYFTSPKSVKEVAKFVEDAEEKTLRLIGLGLMLGGLCIVGLFSL